MSGVVIFDYTFLYDTPTRIFHGRKHKVQRYKKLGNLES